MAVVDPPRLIAVPGRIGRSTTAGRSGNAPRDDATGRSVTLRGRLLRSRGRFRCAAPPWSPRFCLPACCSAPARAARRRRPAPPRHPVAPSEAASSAPSVAPSATPDPCTKDNLTLKTAGKLTIGTDNPAYPPYYDIPDAGATEPWELGDPTNGKGFESAVRLRPGRQARLCAEADVSLGRGSVRQLVRARPQGLRLRHQPGLLQGRAGQVRSTCRTATTRSTSRSSR